jgi:hypothetical protein
MTPPYPLANVPGVHVFLVTGLDGVTGCTFATASQHKAAARWADLHDLGGGLEVQAWHGDHVRTARCDWRGRWEVTP